MRLRCQRGHVPHVWTVAEIQRLREFGHGSGWFYGFVRDGGKLYLTEIFPGLGFAMPHWGRAVLPYHPKGWWWLVRDILRSRP